MRHAICAVAKGATKSRSCYTLSPNPASQSPLTSTCSCAHVQSKGRYHDTSALAEKDDVGGQVSSRPSPLRGAAQWLRQCGQQGQVSDQPSKATNTKRASQGGHDYCATSKGKTSQAQSCMVGTTSSDDMLAIAVNSSPKHAMSRGRKSCIVAAGLFRCSQSVFVSAKYLQCIAA